MRRRHPFGFEFIRFVQHLRHQQLGRLRQLAIHQFIGFVQCLVVARNASSAPDQQRGNRNSEQ